MTDDPRIDPHLERLLAGTPTLRAPDRLRTDIASITSRSRQRPPWLVNLKEPPMRYRSQLVIGSPALRLVAVVATTVALTLAIAGVVIAGASPEPSPTPAPPTPATWVTGHVAPAASCSGPDAVVVGGVTQQRDSECSPQTWTSSDPRLTGKVVRRWSWDDHETEEGIIEVGQDAAYLRNDGGSWACTSSYLARGAGSAALSVTGLTTDCVGEGGYEGLSAILVLTQGGGFSEDFVGLIFAGDFPPVPGPPAAE